MTLRILRKGIPRKSLYKIPINTFRSWQNLEILSRIANSGQPYRTLAGSHCDKYHDVLGENSKNIAFSDGTESEYLYLYFLVM